MIFTNKSELLEYINATLTEDVTNIEIELKLPPAPDMLIETALSFLSTAPKVKTKVITTDQNIIYVENAEYIEGCCGTGKLKLLGREVLINMCECEGNLNVNLNIAINETMYYNVPFHVKLKSNDTDILMELNTSKLK